MIDFNHTIGISLNKDFCEVLEYHLSRTFSNSPDKKTKWVWCDGVSVPSVENQSLENFTETKEVITEALVGPTGQEKCKMVIALGPNSFEKCLKGLSLSNCLPNDQSLDWVDLDLGNKTIYLQLS